MSSREDPKRIRVLFVCVGNSCRSQMAEAIARHYAGHWIEAESAGTSPLGHVARETLAVLQENGIRAEGHYSKGLEDVIAFFEPEVVVNISRRSLYGIFPHAQMVEWEIEDPFGDDEETYRKTYQQIEKRVRKLAEELRKPKS